MKKILIKILLFCVVTIFIQSCRKDSEIQKSEVQKTSKEIDDNYARLYVLNEGNMNENRSTLDYYDYTTWTYNSNIYQEVNPTVTDYLGDVGNDLQIYGSKMFAVINMSNKIEVMEASTATRLGQMNLTNCRYITFYNGYAYATSYSRSITGSTSGDSDLANGIVVKIDTTSLTIVDSIVVGRQPDGVAAVNGKLYVANSGGYSPKNYERTLSVIDLNSFRFVKNIDVAINLNLIQVDSENNLFVISRGNYTNIASKLFKIDTQTDAVVDSIDIQVSNFYISKDTAYVIGSPFGSSNIYFKTISTQTGSVISDDFITDGTSSNMQTPYGILVNPESRNIYVSDALDYQSSGNIYCYSPQGSLIWSAKGGQIPGHFALLKK